MGTVLLILAGVGVWLLGLLVYGYLFTPPDQPHHPPPHRRRRRRWGRWG